MKERRRIRISLRNTVKLLWEIYEKFRKKVNYERINRIDCMSLFFWKAEVFILFSLSSLFDKYSPAKTQPFEQLNVEGTDL